MPIRNTKEDGTIGNGYTITKAYDISQTRGPHPSRPRSICRRKSSPPSYNTALFLWQSPISFPKGCKRSMYRNSAPSLSENGMNQTATICAIAREQAHARFDMVGIGYYRQAYAAQAYCAAYVTAQKFGLYTSAFHFDKVCKSCAEMSADDKRGFIGDVKRAAYTINRDIQRMFPGSGQIIQPDEFSIEAKKPAKSSKAKDETDSGTLR